MPKYFPYKVCGYYLYFTSHCIVECIHAHASNSASLPAKGSAKFFIKNNGDTIVQKCGDLSDKDIRDIQKFIKKNYLKMYKLWRKKSKHGFYGENDRNPDVNTDTNKMNLF